MDPAFTATIAGDFDRRYPEYEMVLGLSPRERPVAFPLREARLAGGVVIDRTRRAVIFAGPAFNESSPFGYTPKGGTGAAVRALVQIAAETAAGRLPGA